MLPSTLTVAAIQMTSGTQLEANLERAAVLVEQAAQNGAHIVLLPEYFCLMGKSDADKIVLGEIPGTGPIQAVLAELARRYRIYLISGTLPIKEAINNSAPASRQDAVVSPEKIRNTTLIYNPEGELLGLYDKIHLFRYLNGDTKENFDESRTIIAGKQAAAYTLETEAGPIRVGLSICYDLRFPELYRQLSTPSPLDLIVVPAAFTYTTGQAHWEVLLRARAIENQCYVLAAAQSGTHENGRRTWGHSMLIDPWGKITTQLEQGEGIVTGQIDLAYLATVRKNLPALQHRCL